MFCCSLNLFFIFYKFQHLTTIIGEKRPAREEIILFWQEKRDVISEVEEGPSAQATDHLPLLELEELQNK
jgi:hypothetical protein